MAEKVPLLEYEHPCEFVILGLEDSNWKHSFSDEERDEIRLSIGEFSLPELPVHMQEFVESMTKASNLEDIFNDVDSKRVKTRSEPQLYWLKSSILSAINLLLSGYLPIKKQKERDIVNRVWHFVTTVFDSSTLQLHAEAMSKVVQQHRNKKRKIALDSRAVKQYVGLIPDMAVSYEKMEFGFWSSLVGDENWRHPFTKQEREEAERGTDYFNLPGFSVAGKHLW
ncbi:hypothetical protein MUCCIDRAFT_166448 [Mucor lusitanicus CBS 277.49]|uniref:Uncharacterized protein n=1 Tax=Mucor lusitanicus CBS 277.49 TaxID=747725 RepID=A0A162Q4X1_MUCCL|nr:hypothetical protein MUCCIDRAFT_166448 [Mucor lusitanicus CBS 277.49]